MTEEIGRRQTVSTEEISMGVHGSDRRNRHRGTLCQQKKYLWGHTEATAEIFMGHTVAKNRK